MDDNAVSKMVGHSMQMSDVEHAQANVRNLVSKELVHIILKICAQVGKEQFTYNTTNNSLFSLPYTFVSFLSLGYLVDMPM